MRGQYLHISFNWKNRLKIDELIPTFNLALDWVRYAPNCWIVWTTSDVSKWYERLYRHLENGDTMLICNLDTSRKQGWLPTWIWEWLDKYTYEEF